MKIQTVLKGIAIGATIITLAACSTKGGKGGAGGMGMDGANGYGAGSGGTYTEGMGSGGSYGTEHCNPPQRNHAYYFDYDSNAVSSEDRARLQSIAQNLAGGNGHAEVVGNTDNRGSREYNVALGWRRADAVASTLEQYGVSRQQINTNSNGAEKPIAFGNSEQDYQCNRRVDVKE